MGSTSFAVFSCALLLCYAGVDSQRQGHHHYQHHHRSRCPMEEADEIPANLQNETLPSGYPYYLGQVLLADCQESCSRMFRCEGIIFLMDPDSEDGKGKCISLFRDQSSRVKFEGKLKLKSKHVEDAVYMVKKCPKRTKRKRRQHKSRFHSHHPASSYYRYSTSSKVYPGNSRGMGSDAYPRSSVAYPGYSRGMGSGASSSRSSVAYSGYSRGMSSDAYASSSSVAYPGYSRGMGSDAYPSSSVAYSGYSHGMSSDAYASSSSVAYPGYSRGKGSDAYPSSSVAYPGYSRGMGSDAYPGSSRAYNSDSYGASHSVEPSSTIAPTPTRIWKGSTSRNEGSSAYSQASASQTFESMSSSIGPTRPYKPVSASAKASSRHPKPTKRPTKRTPKIAPKPVQLSHRPRIKSTRPGSGCRYYKTNVTEARRFYFTNVMRNAPHARLPFNRCMAACDKRPQCNYFSIYGSRRTCCLVVNQYKKDTYRLKHCTKKGKKLRCVFRLATREKIWDGYHQVAYSKLLRIKGKARQTLRECMKRCAQTKGNLCSGIMYRDEIRNSALCAFIMLTPLFGRSCNVLEGEKCKLKQIRRPFTHYKYPVHVKVKNKNQSPAALMKLCHSQCNRNQYCVMVTYKPGKKGRNKWQRSTPPYCITWMANFAMKRQCTGGNCKLVKMASLVTKIPVFYFQTLKLFKRNSLQTCKAECQKNIRQCLGFEVVAAHRAGCRILYELNYQRKVCTAGACKMVPVKKGEKFKVPKIFHQTVLNSGRCLKICAIEESCHSVGMVESVKHCRLFGINIAQPTTYYKQCDASKNCTMKKAQENSLIASYWRIQKDLMVLKRVRGTNSAVCQEACSKVKECTAVFDAWSKNVEFRNCYMLRAKAYHYKKKCRDGQCKSTKTRGIPPSSTGFHVVSKEYGPSHRSCTENCEWNNACYILDIYVNHAAKTKKGGAKHHAKKNGYGIYQHYNAKNGKFVCVVIRHQRIPVRRRSALNPWTLIDFDPSPHYEIRRYRRQCKGKKCRMVYTETTKNMDGFISFTGLTRAARSRSISRCFRKCQAMPDCAFTFIKTQMGGKKPIRQCLIAQDPTMYAKECKKRKG